MVAFITLLSATATLFLACTNVLANPTPDNSIPALLARQTTLDTSKIPAACRSSCEAFINVVANPAQCDITCQCKDTSIDVGNACFTCSAAQDPNYDLKGAQSSLDELAKSCKDAGLPIKSTKNGAMRFDAIGSGAIGVMVLGAVFSLV
ncbi:hypothetical protein Hypma_001590 [Hypsizygus marmoreus]|uniref:Extracellular membrane protein CFEM domain-containing protein n=1 Tax=Hypsizygus marmoreus TaxID=39966 RepID=A0A369JF04_HYPMA|nr:hypothetical protein Hypma_001590 [Hypsizygus marmoreus]